MAGKKQDVPITLRSRHKPDMEMGRFMHGLTLPHTAVVLAVAVAVMAVFNSQGLVDWSMKLPVGPVGDTVIDLAGRWHDWMDAIGATGLRRIIREAFRWFQYM